MPVFCSQRCRYRFATQVRADVSRHKGTEDEIFQMVDPGDREAYPGDIVFLSRIRLILLIIKLVLRDYSVQVGVLSRAMLFSLIAGKVALVPENVHLDEGRAAPPFFERSRACSMSSLICCSGRPRLAACKAHAISARWRSAPYRGST